MRSVLALYSAKYYLRKQVTFGRTVTDLATIQKKGEKSHISKYPFGNPAPDSG